MPGILDYNYSNVPDLEIMPPGDYELQIIAAEKKIDKNGNPGLLVRFRSSVPNTNPVGTWLSLPAEGDSEDVTNGKLRRLGKFVDAFNLPTKSEDAADYVGSSGFARLTVKADDPAYGEQNKIGSFIPPKK